MNTPEVTVLMSVCGTAQWLAEAVLSVVTSGVDYELRIRANGEAGHAEVMRVAQHAPTDRARVILTDHTMPLADSLNEMLVNARGTYTIRLDPDDAQPPGALRKMLKTANECRAVPPVVYGDWLDFGEADRTICCGEPTASALRHRNVASYCYLVPTWLLKQVGGWLEVGYEDWDLFVRLMAAGAQGIPLNETTLYHRVRGDGRLAEMLPNHADHVRGIHERSREWFNLYGVAI